MDLEVVLCLYCSGFVVFEVHFFSLSFFFKKDFCIYLFMRDRERGRDIGRGRSRLPTRSQMWDSILGLWDHTLS